MFDLMRPLILASGSPRRKEILETMGIPFCVDVSDADESFIGTPEETVLELSLRKAEAVAKNHPEEIVLAADTIVCCDGKILGKPSSPEHAAQMLRMLSGNWHSVFTGVALIDVSSGKRIVKADETRVHFTALSDREIEAYISTHEPDDKAGAYAVQGIGGMFIDRIEGSYSNVVGLPMALLRSMLLEIIG